VGDPLLRRAFVRDTILSAVARASAEFSRRDADQDRIFNAVVHSSTDAIVVITLEGRFTAWNTAATRLFGYSRDAVRGQSVDLIVPDAHRDEMSRLIERIARAERVDHFDTVRKHEDGHAVTVSLSLSPVRAEDGTITGAAMIARDINDELHAGWKFRLAFEASPSGMVVIDEAGTILMINHAMETLFGYTRAEATGLSIDRLVPTRFRDPHGLGRDAIMARPIARALGAGAGEILGLRKDGQEFPVEVGLNPIETRNGIRVVASIVDVSERKRAEAALRA
jgi:PAS domain S-box-containing protein